MLSSHFRDNPPGSISGRHLGEAAHRLVANSLPVNSNRNRAGLVNASESYEVNVSAMYPDGGYQRGYRGPPPGHYHRGRSTPQAPMPGVGQYQWQPVERNGGGSHRGGYSHHPPSSAPPILSRPPQFSRPAPYDPYAGYQAQVPAQRQYPQQQWQPRGERGHDNPAGGSNRFANLRRGGDRRYDRPPGFDRR